MEKILINDDRLTPDMERVRAGKIQMFRKPNKSREFINQQNADVVLEPPRRELYAELIDGKWWWVNGCAQCNGKSRGWRAYIECEKHDVCRVCGKKRVDIKEVVWGHPDGWWCESCKEADRKEKAIKALRSVAETEYDETDYHYNDDIVCPHCGTHSNYDGSEGPPESDEICDVCGGEYSVEHEISITFSTACKGTRITVENFEREN